MVIRKTTKKALKIVEKVVEKEAPQEIPQELSTKKLVVIVIHHNTASNLQICMPALTEQIQKNMDIIFIDNASPDREGVEWMHHTYDGNPQITMIANTDNRGFCKAANQGIRMALSRGAKYIAFVSPDVVLSPDYFEKLIAKMNRNPKIASIIGKVYLYDFNNLKPTDIIDSAGLFALKHRRIVDIGQGMIDDGRFNAEKEVFGVSCVCPVYRAEALEDVKVLDEYFDEDFFHYKEDADLSWRFLLYGWKNFYLPEAVAYHSREAGAYKRFSTTEFLKSRKHVSKVQRQMSFRNHLLMIQKNELWSSFFRDFLHNMLVRILTPIYITMVEPCLWKSYWQYLRKLPAIRKKRKIILQNKRISASEMSRWFRSRKSLEQ